MTNIVKVLLTAFAVLTIFFISSLEGAADQTFYTCNKCEGTRICQPCWGTGTYSGNPCAICVGSGLCYYCNGKGRL